MKRPTFFKFITQDKFLWKIVALTFILILFKLSNENDYLRQEIKRYNCLGLLNDTNYIKPNVRLFNLSSPLKPKYTYDAILCRNSNIYYKVSTLLCVHDPYVDIHVSASIWLDGIWEEENLSNSIRIELK
jgi:hypothetical protein